MSTATTKWFFVANPRAGGARDQQLASLEKALRQHFPALQFVRTKGPGDAEHLAREARRQGFQHFGVAGGDGTIHEVVNGIFADGPGHTPPGLVVYPLGSGNDWARSLGFSKKIPALIDKMQACSARPTSTTKATSPATTDDPQNAPGDDRTDATKDAAHRADAGSARLTDIGIVRYRGADGDRQRYFCNVAGIAFDAAVAQSLSRAKQPLGRWAYLSHTLQLIFRYRAPKLQIETPEQQWSGRFVTVNIGLQPYSGGGMQIVPHARNRNDTFALTAIRHSHPLRLLRHIYRLYNGSIAKAPFSICSFAETLRVTHDQQAAPLEADGEFLGHTPAQFFIVKNALRVP